MPYEESLRLLKNTTNVVELTVSQIYSEYQRKLQQKSLDAREISEHNHGSGKLLRRSNNANIFNGPNNNEQNQFGKTKKAQCSENSLLTFKKEQDNFNIDKINNDNDTSCCQHDDCDNNTHDKDVTVLITNNQLSKNPCNAPKLVNTHSHFTNTNTATATATIDTPQSFQKYGFNAIPQPSDALNCSHTEMMSDNCLISANNCIPDLPKVNLQQLS